MIDKILRIGLLVLIGITVIVLGIFIFGGNVPDQLYTTPVYTSTLLNWAYILVIIAAVAAIIFPIARLFTRPKQAMKTFIGIGALAVIVLIAYAMSDGTVMNIVGYTGTDNVPSTLKFADTIIYTMYILFGASILAIFGTEILRKFR
ncbi:MAG: hypothetical protein LIO65_04750 [Odoribacter sp.]|nr:hypothetical protein [Odoribacter sp.]